MARGLGCKLWASRSKRAWSDGSRWTKCKCIVFSKTYGVVAAFGLVVVSGMARSLSFRAGRRGLGCKLWAGSFRAKLRGL